jgi:hypothetical protein
VPAAGIQTELLAKNVARVLIGAERFAVSAGAIQRQHLLPPQLLPQRMLCGQQSELGDELLVLSQCQLGVDTPLERGRAELLQPHSVALRETVVEVFQGGAPPQLQCRPQSVRSLRDGTFVQQTTPFLHQPSEADRVDHVGLDIEPVAGCGRRHHGVILEAGMRLKGPADLADHDLDAVEGVANLLFAPQLLDDASTGHDFTHAQTQQSDQRVGLLPTKLDAGALVVQEFERSKKAELHMRDHTGPFRPPPGRISCVERPAPDAAAAIRTRRSWTTSRRSIHGGRAASGPRRGRERRS